MPKSKRAKVVHLSKVDKKGKDLTLKLYSSIRECLDQYQYCFVFSVDNMRNTYLKNVRTELSDSRYGFDSLPLKSMDKVLSDKYHSIFFGKTKVMSKALGHTPEEEYLPSLSQLSSHLSGNVGLLFTNRPPDTVIEYFSTLSETDFARAGTIATRDFTIPPGLVYSTAGEIAQEDDTPLAHSMEAELRKLLVPTKLVKGKVVLESREGYSVCGEGDTLDSRQTRLLKMFGVRMAEFRVRLVT